MINRKNQIQPPDTLLILGTDASGKNYVANFITEMIENSGYDTEKRDGWLSAEATQIISSEDKGFIDLLKEKAFISTFGFTKFFMPPLLSFLIRKDVRRFKKSRDKKVIVISHTALRILAFYLGHVFEKEESIRIPYYLEKSLKLIVPFSSVKTIILDIDDEVRKARVAKRLIAGKADVFDQYMARDGDRSERIERFLVWIGVNYLNAFVIENNDPDDDKLFSLINQAFMDFMIKSS